MAVIDRLAAADQTVARIGDEAEDVRHYRQRANPAFPHEPTIDQFFDEAAVVESYRKLAR
jgi:hypothetical protein